MSLPKGRALLLLFFLSLPLLPAQGSADELSLVGITLNELILRFGVPRSVSAARGLEEWQDDVVFEYGDRDYYVYKDRVWQVALKAAMGLKAGDSREAVLRKPVSQKPALRKISGKRLTIKRK